MMPYMPIENIVLFLTTAVVMICTPGPDIIYVSTRGIAQGRDTALLSTLGVCLGYLVHTALAVLGLSALLQASAIAFEMVRYAGAAYLLYLGVKTLLSKEPFLPTQNAQPLPKGRIVWQGVLTSVLNPKGILFFLSFLPQFISPQSGHVSLQLIVYGLTFTVLCLLIYGAIGYCSGQVGDRLTKQPTISLALKWLSGSVLVGLGIRMAWPERK
jgi:threonine/homoserine/homoserine lactone efflux protein